MRRNIVGVIGLVTFLALYLGGSKLAHDNDIKEQRERDVQVALIGALQGACAVFDGAILQRKCIKGAHVYAEVKDGKLTIYRKDDRPLIDGDRREV